jgi:hypothetical protein
MMNLELPAKPRLRPRRVMMPLLILISAVALTLWSRANERDDTTSLTPTLRSTMQSICRGEPATELQWPVSVLQDTFEHTVRGWCQAGSDPIKDVHIEVIASPDRVKVILRPSDRAHSITLDVLMREAAKPQVVAVAIDDAD